MPGILSNIEKGLSLPLQVVKQDISLPAQTLSVAGKAAGKTSNEVQKDLGHAGAIAQKDIASIPSTLGKVGSDLKTVGLIALGLIGAAGTAIAVSKLKSKPKP